MYKNVTRHKRMVNLIFCHLRTSIKNAAGILYEAKSLHDRASERVQVRPHEELIHYIHKLKMSTIHLTS